MNQKHYSMLLVLIFIFFVVTGCFVQKTFLRKFEFGSHVLKWYKFEGGDVSSFGGWFVTYGLDCGILLGNPTIYSVEPADFDSLSVVFLSNDSVVIVPMEAGIPVDRLSCKIDLKSIDCEFMDTICNYSITDQ